MRTLAPQPANAQIPAIAWEECACLLCGSAMHLPLFEASDPLGGMRFLIVQCTRCGLCFTNPRPDLVSIKRFYPADYRCHHTYPERQRGDDGAPRGISAAISSLALGVSPGARLLDFGCGTGGFLRRMAALGWHVTGLDMSESAVSEIHELPAHVGTLPNPLWTEPCFEAITMWQSLEHTHQPLEVMHAAYRLLTGGGKLLVAVPNFDSFASRWFGSTWYGLDVPRHLTHFTPETLRLMLGRAGFERIDIRQERHHSWIRHSARSGFLRTRLGSGLAGWWGYATGRADGLIAIATK